MTYIGRPSNPRGLIMPIRTASLNKQIQKNGARLHHAMATRVHSDGAERPASEQEKTLLDERRSLKQAKLDRQAEARQPRPKAAMMPKATKPPKEPKAPKAAKEPKEPKPAKASAKDHKPSRADKLAKKAENLESAKKAQRKSAKA
jgi:outer membrane biosynthesis protein TonB